jgi:V/A-type H+-transporting ATPase subunit A
MAKSSGRVTGINGNMVTVEFEGNVSQNEVGYIHLSDEERLKSEVIQISGNIASLQVFEMTGGVKVGDVVEFAGEMLSVELGPGLLTQIYDGLQNPLPELAIQIGFFLQRGVYLKPKPDADRELTPVAKVVDK